MLSHNISLTTYHQQSIYYHTYTSPYGEVILFVTREGICGLHFLTHPEAYHIESIHKKLGTPPQCNPAQTDHWWRSLHDPKTNVKVCLQGTPFQRCVWEALSRIPKGTVTSYTTIAQQLGSPQSARAVAQACAQNIIACLIPCHRVLSKDYQISGYRWGIDRKISLLTAEKAWPIPKFQII